MKIARSPNFGSQPGHALGPVVGSTIAEEAVSRAFDVAMLAGLGRIASLGNGRARALRGLAAPNTESRPDIVAEAQSRANAQGIPLSCREDIIPWAPGQYYYFRCCSVPGSGCIFGADPIATYTQPYQWDGLRLDIAMETGAGAAHADAQGIWSGGQVTPYIPVPSPLPPPVIGTPPPLTAQETAIQTTNSPGASVPSQQPGEIVVPPTQNTGESMNKGMEDEELEAQSRFASLFDSEMDWLVWAGVAVVALVVMGGKR